MDAGQGDPGSLNAPMGSCLAPRLASGEGGPHRGGMNMVTSHLVWALLVTTLPACADVSGPSRGASTSPPGAGLQVPPEGSMCTAIRVDVPGGVSTCAARGCMVVKARREAERGGCWEPEAPVGCMEQRGCEDAIALARDPAGKLHSFDDLCIPEGWREEPSGRELPACAAPAAAASRVNADVRLVIEGLFAPDHLGPGAHAEVVARVRADPRAHLAALERIVHETHGSGALSALHPPALLELVVNVAPDEARAVAGALAAVYRRALGEPGRDPQESARLTARVAAIELLAR